MPLSYQEKALIMPGYGSLAGIGLPVAPYGGREDADYGDQNYYLKAHLNGAEESFTITDCALGEDRSEDSTCQPDPQYHADIAGSC